MADLCTAIYDTSASSFAISHPPSASKSRLPIPGFSSYRPFAPILTSDF